MNENELLRLKRKITEGKEELASLKGQKKYLLEQLKEQFDCVSLASAEKLLQRKKEDLEILENQINDGLEELDEKYGKLS